MRWYLVAWLTAWTLSCGKTSATDAGLPHAREDMRSDAGERPFLPTATATSVASASPTTASASGDAGPDLPDDPKLSFVDNRVQHAKAGMTEIVSMRVWHCGPSCTCPSPCIETVSAEGPMRWIDLIDTNGKPVSLADWANADVVGQFTGRLRKASGPSPEEYLLPELRLIGAPVVVGTAMAPDGEGTRPKVVLAGAAAMKTVPKVVDDRPYLVVAGNFSLADAPRSEGEVQKLLKKVQDAGFADAERYDSRAFSGLACCFDIVLGGRFADAKSAEARRAALAAKGIKAYVKKGF